MVASARIKAFLCYSQIIVLWPLSKLSMDDSKPTPEDIEQALVDRWQRKSRVSAFDVQRAESLRGDSRSGLSEWLVNLGMVSERERCDGLAQLLGLSILVESELPEFPVEGVAASPAFLKQYRLCPLTRDEVTLRVAMADPHQAYAQQALALATGLKVQPVLATATEIQALIDRLYGGEVAEPEDMAGNADLGQTGDDSEDIAHLRDMAQEAPVVRLVNQIIQRAVEWRASDIHIEPFEQSLSLRYRIDGVLQHGESPPMQLAAAIISRLKIMAKLNIAERRLPQDGRMMVRVQGKTLDLRVSVLPTAFGESLVMRLLDRESLVLDFTAMGFSGPVLDALLPLLQRPNGILLVTGPTGSGKTTTLYGALSVLNAPGVKIITVEDPVEYQLAGINQMQVKPQIGLDFANALRAIVRQDPDIIMIGEMRDAETARIAIQSALTGHLVLSTLHTNSAAGGITRLLDMGVEPYLINSTINGILAQRLVRRLNPETRERYQPDTEQIARWRLRELQPEGPIYLYRPRPGTPPQNAYMGRTVISELLPMDDALRQAVSRRDGLAEIERISRQSGRASLWHDGIGKALAGITSLEEVLRISQGDAP